MPNAKLITDRQLIVEMQCCLWRDEARRAGVAEADIERSVFLRWRVERGGGVRIVVYGLGRMRPLGEA